MKLSDVARHSTERNNNKLSSDDLMGVDKKNGIIPMRDQVKGNSVTNCKVINPGYFAYNPMRLNIGSIGCWYGNKQKIVSPDYVVFSCLKERLEPAYFDLLTQSLSWKNFVSNTGSGSVRNRIYFKDIESFEFKCPPKNEQKNIIDLVFNVEEIVKLNSVKRENAMSLIFSLVS